MSDIKLETPLQCDDIRSAVEPYLRKLADLQTADEIRDFLVTEGVQAVPGNATKCAIAEYLFQASGQVVGVTRKSTVVLADKWARGIGKHTEAMSEFVIRFDHYQYPELVAEEKLGRIEKVMLQALTDEMKELLDKKSPLEIEEVKRLDNLKSWVGA